VNDIGDLLYRRNYRQILVLNVPTELSIDKVGLPTELSVGKVGLSTD